MALAEGIEPRASLSALRVLAETLEGALEHGTLGWPHAAEVNPVARQVGQLGQVTVLEQAGGNQGLGRDEQRVTSESGGGGVR
jgi:hypothetical protein